jgi:copper chaperone CopZ
METTGESTIHLVITGMDCAGCAKSVTQALGAVSGVTRTEVDLDKGRAHVHVKGGISSDVLVKAVEKAGYGAHIAPAG